MSNKNYKDFPKKLTKKYIEENLYTKSKKNFNTNLFKLFEIPNEYNWCKTKGEYLNCILLNIKEEPKCKKENCNNSVSYNSRIKEKYRECCSQECKNYKKIIEKARETKKKKYGNEVYVNTEKAKETKKEKYGNEVYVNHEKAKETKKKKYGNENYNNIRKTKETKKEKYGNEVYVNPEKAKETKKEKYGNENYNNIEKNKKTCLEKYGVNNYSKTIKYKKEQSKRLREKSIETINKNNISQKHIKNYQNLTKEYIETYFLLKDNKIKLNEMCEYFNITNTTVYSYLKKFKIKYKRKTNMELELNNIFNNSFEINKRDILVFDKVEDQKIKKVNLELDLYSEEKKIGIEYNGLMFHSFGCSKHSIFNNSIEENQNKENHLLKTDLCEEKGIQLFHIFENEWLNPIKKNIWKSIINNKLNITKPKRIFARKCYIENLSDKEKSKKLTNKKKLENNKLCNIFEKNNHLQGMGKSKIKLGLFFDLETEVFNEETKKIEIKKEKKMLSLMTFGLSRFSKEYEYELIRFCTKVGYQVIGGASKLLKHFERQYSPKSLVSYANRRWSLGNLYKKLNFTLKHKSKPNFFYFKPSNIEKSKQEIEILESRNKYQKYKLKEYFKKKNNLNIKKFDEEKTGNQNMYDNGFRRIWDSGNIIFYKIY